MNSLRVRLFVFLLALSAAAALAVGGATYFSVRAEADQLFDYQLRQMALSLRDQGRIAPDQRAALPQADIADFDYVVQIWSVDGVELYSTLPAAPLSQLSPFAPRAVLGFSTQDVAGARWRVFSAATPLRIVQVAQPLAARRALAANAAGRSVLPIALAAPLVALAMWWLVGATLAPLARVVGAVQQRDAGALEPLPADGLPAELAPLLQSFNHLLGRLARSFDAQRAFVADAAHELRSPLTALKLQISLLRDARDAAERSDAVARLQAGVERAHHLVEQLLALARADPAAALSHSAIDLVQTARLALADSQPLADTLRARLSFSAPPALPLRGDPQALRSLVRNLLDNALRHGGAPPQAPQVQLTLALSDRGGALICVDDAGPGIPADARGRVFDRFHRRDPGSGTGSGLGLAIARAVAGQHGGQVTLADSPLGGLRAEVRLPGAAPSAAGATGPAA